MFAMSGWNNRKNFLLCVAFVLKFLSFIGNPIFMCVWIRRKRNKIQFIRFLIIAWEIFIDLLRNLFMRFMCEISSASPQIEIGNEVKFIRFHNFLNQKVSLIERFYSFSFSWEALGLVFWKNIQLWLNINNVIKFFFGWFFFFKN